MDRIHLLSAARDKPTLDFYAKEAPLYVASGKGGVSRWLEPFMQALPTGARVLELGCGGGRDAEAMLNSGFDVDPTDGTPEIAAKAEERLGRKVRVMRFDELSAIDAYDAVWANASLLHVPRHALPAVLGLIFRALKPGGLHFANYKGGGLEGRDNFDRYFNYMDVNALIDAYSRSSPWTISLISEYTGGGYQSSQSSQGPWLAVTAYRPPK